MPIRPLLAPAALLAAAAAAPAAPAQVVLSRPVAAAPRVSYAPPAATAGPVPSGIVLRPGERLVTPAPAPRSPSAPNRIVRTGGTFPATPFPTTTFPTTPFPTTTVPTAAPRPATAAPAAGVGGSAFSGGDQQRAQAEANLMAARGIRGHVGGTIGRFEGVGWSSSGTPNTCTPPAGMRLTADAIARGPGGVYRVRAWR